MLLSGSGDECSPVVSSFNGEGKQNEHVTRGMHRVKTQKNAFPGEESIEMNLSDLYDKDFLVE